MTPNKAMDQVGEVADTLDNLYHALLLPIAPSVHIEQFKLALPQLICKLRDAYREQVGDDPWE